MHCYSRGCQPLLYNRLIFKLYNIVPQLLEFIDSYFRVKVRLVGQLKGKRIQNKELVSWKWFIVVAKIRTHVTVDKKTHVTQQCCCGSVACGTVQWSSESKTSNPDYLEQLNSWSNILCKLFYNYPIKSLLVWNLTCLKHFIYKILIFLRYIKNTFIL